MRSTSGRSARPGSQNRLSPPISTIAVIPATFSSGPSRAKLMSVPTIGRRSRWSCWRGYSFSNGTTRTNSPTTAAKIELSSANAMPIAPTSIASRATLASRWMGRRVSGGAGGTGGGG